MLKVYTCLQVILHLQTGNKGLHKFDNKNNKQIYIES